MTSAAHTRVPAVHRNGDIRRAHSLATSAVDGHGWRVPNAEHSGSVLHLRGGDAAALGKSGGNGGLDCGCDVMDVAMDRATSDLAALLPCDSTELASTDAPLKPATSGALVSDSAASINGKMNSSFEQVEELYKQLVQLLSDKTVSNPAALLQHILGFAPEDYSDLLAALTESGCSYVDIIAAYFHNTKVMMRDSVHNNIASMDNVNASLVKKFTSILKELQLMQDKAAHNAHAKHALGTIAPAVAAARGYDSLGFGLSDLKRFSAAKDSLQSAPRYGNGTLEAAGKWRPQPAAAQLRQPSPFARTGSVNLASLSRSHHGLPPMIPNGQRSFPTAEAALDTMLGVAAPEPMMVPPFLHAASANSALLQHASLLQSHIAGMPDAADMAVNGMAANGLDVSALHTTPYDRAASLSNQRLSQVDMLSRQASMAGNGMLRAAPRALLSRVPSAPHAAMNGGWTDAELMNAAVHHGTAWQAAPVTLGLSDYAAQQSLSGLLGAEPQLMSLAPHLQTHGAAGLPPTCLALGAELAMARPPLRQSMAVQNGAHCGGTVGFDAACLGQRGFGLHGSDSHQSLSHMAADCSLLAQTQGMGLASTAWSDTQLGSSLGFLSACATPEVPVPALAVANGNGGSYSLWR